MAEKANARRYAQAVFELALEKKELERWQADLQKIAGEVKDATFFAAMEHPKIKLEDKARFLKERLGKVNPLAVNLVLLLITRSGFSILPEVIDEYQRLMDEYHGVQKAEVVTAVPLDDAEKRRLAEKLGAAAGAKVEIEAKVDPAILGGVIARMGGRLLDGSTRSKLAALKRELEGGGRI